MSPTSNTEHITARARLPVSWWTVGLFALLLTAADGFWATSLRGAVGYIEATQQPFPDWLRYLVVMLPIYGAAVFGALWIAQRLTGGRRGAVANRCRRPPHGGPDDGDRRRPDRADGDLRLPHAGEPAGADAAPARPVRRDVPRRSGHRHSGGDVGLQRPLLVEATDAGRPHPGYHADQRGAVRHQFPARSVGARPAGRAAVGASPIGRARPRWSRSRSHHGGRGGRLTSGTLAPMIIHLIDGTYELFRHFYGLRRFSEGDGSAVRRGRRRAAHRAADDRGRRDARRRRHRSRHRVVPQRPVARLQDRRGHRAGAAGRSSSRWRRRSWRWASRSGRWSSWKPTTRSPPRRASRPTTSASRRSASGRRTRISRSASAATASCRSTARATRCATPTACARSSASTPALIPDYLALVGDAADGYPGIPGIGAMTAARLLNQLRTDRGLPGGGPRRQPRARRCCSSASRPCGRRPTCSTTSSPCAGPARPRKFAAVARQLDDDRLAGRAAAAAGA